MKRKNYINLNSIRSIKKVTVIQNLDFTPQDEKKSLVRIGMVAVTNNSK